MMMVIKRFAIGSNHAIHVQVELIGLIIVDHPSRLVMFTWNSIPFLLEIVIILLQHSGDRITFLPDRICHEILRILGNDTRLRTDGTTIGIRVETYNTLSQSHQ